MRSGEPVEFVLPTRPPARCPACGRGGLVANGGGARCDSCRVAFTPAALAVGRQIAERVEFEARGRSAREVLYGEA